MSADNLDDLFRQQLGQHATPPSAELARRLAELAEAERLDALFRTGLGSHASQPRRALWARLEDEHLRPQPQRRHRVVAWWQLSAAAVLLLTLLAGGLWRGGYLQPDGGLASHPSSGAPTDARPSQVPATTTLASRPQSASPTLAQTAAAQVVAQSTASLAEKKQKSFSGQATASNTSSSSPSIAATTRPRRAATASQIVKSSQPQRQQPDAATGQLAITGRRNSPASQPLPTSPEEPASRPNPALVAMTSATEVVEVEVRRGPEPSRPAPAAVVAAAEPEPSRRPRLRLGGLLRQADHLVHGEPVSLAEATGLAETVTVQARFGSRVVSKTVQL
ncbi:MAG: hypothetical protein ACRYF0_19595 [Janthinobacterium lividum]